MFLKSLRSSNWRERHSAGTVLLDRALGKPAQPVTGEDGQPITFLHLVAVREAGEKVVAELTAEQSRDVIDRPAPLLDDGGGAVIEARSDSVIDLSVPAAE
jgi:hypothetical protein